MRIDSNTPLPDAFLSKLPPEERRRMGKAGVTSAEAQAKYQAGKERELKNHVLNTLNRRGAWLFEQPMNKKTRGRRGVPDILACYRGYFVAIELKTGKEGMTREQAQEAARIRQAAGYFILALCLEDVIEGLNGIDADDM